MIEHRPFSSLGQTKIDWLHGRHHFSFGSYRAPNRDHWGRLRVWNDDVIQPQSGFDPHPHDNMEIITYVRRGAISHKDNLGNSGRTEAGDVQIMSAGTGIVHAEYNYEAEPTEIFQIWIFPDSRNEPPAWGTRAFPQEARAGQFVALASGFAEDTEALPIRAAARVLGATLKAGDTLSYEFSTAQRFGYLVPARGQVEVNGLVLETRDGAAIHDEKQITISALSEAEIVLVDTAALD